MENFTKFIDGSSKFSDGLGEIIETTFKFIMPLVNSAEGLVKLLKLLP
ncbi:hypothetical protein QP968_04420 [Corynebacterium sp. MSK041]|nr:hypothetical protein [Corynebacterium sp. MSK041]MDK8794952.1 hypothetical protein [Corynebacterium sp. MSK041]